MKEIWRKIPGYREYEVSDFGRVRSITRIDRQGRKWPGRILKPQNHGPRYLHVTLQTDDGPKHPLIHQLVLLTFRGDCPPGFEGAHLDGDDMNNALSNLEWKRPLDNADDRRRHGTSGVGDANSQAEITDACVPRMRDMAAIGISQRVIADWFFVSQQHVSRLLRGTRRNHA